MYQYAITRLPPQSMAAGITTQTEPVDADLARKQHEEYVATIQALGIRVTVLQAIENLPDSHFVEDTAIIHKQVAILTNPGADARRQEVTHIRSSLEEVMEVRELSHDNQAFVDGGDVLFMGNHVMIGISYRTNLVGAENLKTRLHEIDPKLKVHFVPFEGVLHLKSGLIALGDDLLIGNPHIKLKQPLPAGNVVWLPKEQGYAASTLVANGSALYFQECEAAGKAIQQAGLTPIGIDLSEFRKMDGSFTCLSLLW